MVQGSRWLCVATALAVVFFCVCSVDANACDKSKAQPTASVVVAQPVPAGCGCPPVPCCCEDATICIIEESPPVCYTENGLRAFAAIFRGAATRGVENATIRAFNSTKVVPDCVDCDKDKKACDK